MKTVLLITHIESPMFRSIAESVSVYSRKRGWALHIVSADNAVQARKIAKTWNADGCIIYAARPCGVKCAAEKWPMPIVLVSPSGKHYGKHSVCHDSHFTGRIAAKELARLGLDRFAFVANVPHQSWATKRLATFCETLREYKRDVEIFRGGDLLSFLRSLPPRCGLFAANDLMAEKIVSVAKAANIKIPEDLTVLGCDDDARICEHSEVTISSIRPDYTRGGMLVVNMLADLLDGNKTEKILLFGDTGVIHRASTRTFSKTSPKITAALEYIRLNAFSGISASDVIARMKGSRRSAETAFRTMVGHSILEEIQMIRINEIKRLLANPMVKISAIAARTGYSSENFLTRLFKRETGMTPSQWRAKNTTAVSQ